MSIRSRVLLVAFGVVMGLLVIVLALPLVRRNTPAPDVTELPCQAQPGAWFVQVRQLLHDYREPCAQFYWMPDPSYEFYGLVRLNNYGLHAPDIAPKAEGVFRILIVGDSFPQGMQVSTEETFPYLLQKRFDTEGKRIEIINLSMDAYGTDRELLLYALLGWQFQPDLVVLSMYIGNDVQDNEIDLETLRYGYRLTRPFFTLENDALQLHESPLFDADLYPDAPTFAWLRDLQSRQTPAPPDNLPSRPVVLEEPPNYRLEYPVEIGLYLKEDSYWSSGWALTEALVTEFKKVVSQNNIPMVALVLPDRRAVHSEDWSTTLMQYSSILPDLAAADPTAPGTRLEKFLDDSDIPVLNLTWTLRSWATSNPGERLYYLQDGHFNAQGHNVTAERVGQWLESLNLLP